MYKRKYWIVLSFLFILSIFMACGNEIHHITPESIDRLRMKSYKIFRKKLIYIVILPVCQYPKKNEITGL